MSKRTEILLIATGFPLIATVCTAISLRFIETVDPAPRILWMLAHFPAVIAYIGTLAEHDPLKGGGFVFFAFIQWAVIGFGLGWVATLRRSRGLR